MDGLDEQGIGAAKILMGIRRNEKAKAPVEAYSNTKTGKPGRHAPEEGIAFMKIHEKKRRGNARVHADCEMGNLERCDINAAGILVGIIGTERRRALEARASSASVST